MTRLRGLTVFAGSVLFSVLTVSAVAGISSSALAEGDGGGESRLLTVEVRDLVDPKAVFATVESADVVSARVRIGGTIAELAVDEGDEVAAEQVIAVIGDEKLALQMKALDAQIAALTAQAKKANEDLRRADELFKNRTIARARLDEVKAAADVANNALKSRQADLSVIRQQVDDGAVKAPSAGRVLHVPVTDGMVVMPGESVATIAVDSYILRLRLPERHARFLSVGDEIRLAGSDLGEDVGSVGVIRKVYPQIDQGRVVADAEVEGLSSYFVGQRVRVWVDTDVREGIVVPVTALSEQFGVDTVMLKKDDGVVIRVPVQRGQARTVEGMGDGVEILSGLHDGDVILISNPHNNP